MARERTTELALAVSPMPGGAPSAVTALWTLKQPDRQVHPVHQSVLVLPSAQAAPLASDELEATLRVRLLVPEVELALATCVQAGQQPGAWARLAVSLSATALEALPWEGAFAPYGLPVVRRERRPESFLWRPLVRPPLAFPLAVRIVAFDDALAAETELADDYMRAAGRMGAVDWAVSDRGARPPTADILHVLFSPSSETDLLAWLRLRPREPRLLVLHGVGQPAASGVTAAQAQEAAGAEAVLYAVGPVARETLRAFYRKVFHDWPLDESLEEARRRSRWALGGAFPAGMTILRCADRGETCVSLSRLLVETVRPPVGAKQVTFRGGDRFERTMAVPPIGRSEQLRAEWALALRRPAESVAARASELVISEELHDLDKAILLAREAQAVAAEQPEVDKTLSALQDLSSEKLDETSARTTELSVSDPAAGGEVPREQALVVGRPYVLTVQVVRQARSEAWASSAFPEEALRETLARVGEVYLDVMLFADRRAVELKKNRDKLRLARLGDGGPVSFDFIPRGTGAFAIRACLYYGTVLLQSVVLEGRAETAAGAAGATRTTLDYAASADLMLLEQLPQPDVTIFTNQAVDGSHWFGVFTGQQAEKLGLTNGAMATLSASDLAELARGLQETLLGVEMQKSQPGNLKAPKELTYRFEPPVPATPEQRRERARQLVDLAARGWEVYSGLFPDRTAEQSVARSAEEGLLSIARCRPDRTSIAWAAIYDYYLDTGRPDLELCPVFDTQRAAGDDLLDRPTACRAQPTCPLSDAQKANRTVCPFGFWGFRHRIEQPPQHVKLETPEQPVSRAELHAAARLKTAVTYPATERPRLGVGFWPHFDNRVRQHLEDLRDLGEADLRSDRDEILKLVQQGGRQLYYFFCHGEGDSLSFKLRVGPSQQADTIGVATLNSAAYQWPPEGPAPLVFLNGCDTMAFKAETINKFLERLRAMGASGIIGTEVPVHSHLAEEVGRQLLGALTAGRPLGQALLETRRRLLREQLNPLGLAYTFFGSAALHLCPGTGCPQCDYPKA